MAAQASGNAGEASPLCDPSGQDAVSGLLASLCCRRRGADVEEAAVRKRYDSLLSRGRGLPEKRKLWYDKLCWWSDVPTKAGSRIFVLAPRGPQGQNDFPIDMWELMSYCLVKLDDHVVKEGRKFAVVWVQLSDHRLWPLDFRRLKSSLHRNYESRLEAVHVVHPSWTVRALRLILWPLAEDALWERFHSHERIEFLDTHVDLKKFRFPRDIYEYDKWLDKQAQEANDQASKKFGGGLGGGLGSGAGSGGEDGKSQEQFSAVKRLVEERQRDMAKDGKAA